MATIILNHQVKDYSEWKKHYDKDLNFRTSLGLKEIKVGVKSDDSEHVYIILEADHYMVIENFISDPELKNKMDQSGVVGPPNIAIIL
jgi:hypothetical protein